MLTLFHDYTSPGSAVAVARLTRLADDGMRVRIVGTEVLGLATHLPVTLHVLAELDAVAAAAAREGVVLRRPATVPPTATAHLVADVAERHDLAAAWRARCYRAYWADGEDIADATVLRRLGQQVGLPDDEVAQALNDRVALLAIRQRFAGHRRDGVGGVPMISYEGTLIPGLLDDDDLRGLASLDP